MSRKTDKRNRKQRERDREKKDRKEKYKREKRKKRKTEKKERKTKERGRKKSKREKKYRKKGKTKERKDTEKDKRKRKEIATIIVKNLKTQQKILTVLHFYLGNSNFFIIFYHLNGQFFIFDFISDFYLKTLHSVNICDASQMSFKDCFRVTHFLAIE